VPIAAVDNVEIDLVRSLVVAEARFGVRRSGVVVLVSTAATLVTGLAGPGWVDVLIEPVVLTKLSWLTPRAFRRLAAASGVVELLASLPVECGDAADWEVSAWAIPDPLASAAPTPRVRAPAPSHL
jgi:hypothetical protein